MNKTLIIILFITNLIKCENINMDKKYAINLLNNAEHSIGCYFALGGKYGTLYPDTVLPATNQYIIKEIKSGSRYIYDSGIKWNEIFSKLLQDTLSIYIFHTDTLKQNSWEEIKNGYKVLKRYDLSLEDLENLNWELTYP